MKEKETIIKHLAANSDLPEFFPNENDFAAAGYHRLWESMRKGNTHNYKYWAKKLNLKESKNNPEYQKAKREKINQRALKRLEEYCSTNKIKYLNEEVLVKAFSSVFPEKAIKDPDTGKPLTLQQIAQELGLRYRWDKPTIEIELKELIAKNNLERFPFQREFNDSGKAPLLEAIKRQHGGLDLWAKKMNLPRTGSSAGVKKTKWNNLRIEKELNELIENHGEAGFAPTSKIFMEHNLPLWSAIAQRGGIGYWAEKMNLKQQHKPVMRTKATASQELQDFTSFLGKERFPKAQEFRKYKKNGLYTYIRKNGGGKAWAEKLGLRYYWDERTIEIELKEFILKNNFKRFPLHREFVVSGEKKLLEAMKRHQGVNYWSKKINLPRGKP